MLEREGTAYVGARHNLSTQWRQGHTVNVGKPRLAESLSQKIKPRKLAEGYVICLRYVDMFC